MDYYPREFSGQARARVEAERLKSKQEFQRRRSEKPPPEWKKSSREWDLYGFYSYILRVFLAYAHEACELAKKGVWTVDRITSMAHEFLRRFTINAHYEDGRDRSGEKFPDVTGSNLSGSLRSDLVRFFRNTKQWQEYEAEVLAVAEELADRGRATEADPRGWNRSPAREEHFPVSSQEISPKQSTNATHEKAVPAWVIDLSTAEGRKAAREGWKRQWTTEEHECTNDDLTETAYRQKDRAFLNQWENGTTRLKDPDRSTRVQAIEDVLRENKPPNWHSAAKRTLK